MIGSFQPVSGPVIAVNPPDSSPGSPEEPLRTWAGGLLAGAHRDTRAPCGDSASLVAFLRHHGIGPCLEDLLAAEGLALPDGAATPGNGYQLVAAEMVRVHEFSTTLAHVERVVPERPIIFKGQALAYDLYRQPWLRPRADIDVLIEKHHHGALREALRGAGYREATAIDGDLVLRQATMRKEARSLEHLWDVHWALSNRPALAGVLDPARLRRNAVTVHADEMAFLAPGPVHGLLIACMHLIGHHAPDPRLIWLYDIHLLAASMSERERALFLEEAGRSREARSACHAALALAAAYLPAETTRRLAGELDPGSDGARSGYRFYAGRLLQDARALDAGSRLRFLRQHAFPSADYMMKRFGLRHRWQVPIWYVVRIGRAIPKLFRRR